MVVFMREICGLEGGESSIVRGGDKDGDGDGGGEVLESEISSTDEQWGEF